MTQAGEGEGHVELQTTALSLGLQCFYGHTMQWKSTQSEFAGISWSTFWVLGLRPWIAREELFNAEARIAT